jgi:hypothetical protein
MPLLANTKLLTFVYEQFKPDGVPAGMIAILNLSIESVPYKNFNALDRWMFWFIYYEKFVKLKNEK